jgi:hypothetical protein
MQASAIPVDLAVEQQGVPARIRSVSFKVLGNVHIFLVRTRKGLYYKIVSDVNPDVIRYVEFDLGNDQYFDGFPTRDEFMGMPVLEDNSKETEELINKTNEIFLDSQAIDRYASRTGKGDKVTGMTFGPIFQSLNDSNIRKHSIGLDAKRLFNRSGLSRNWTEKKSLRQSLTNRNTAATAAAAAAARKGWFWGGKKSRKTRRRTKKRQTRKRK